MSTPATRRWRAGFLCALCPISAGSTVNRPRLAPGRVMSTTLGKTNGWSIGADESCPLLNEIPRDWRHSVFLTRRAARKQVYFASESPENQ